MKRLLALLVLPVFMISLLTISNVCFAQSAEDLTYLTEDFPPFNFEKDGGATGIAPDLLAAIFKQMGSKLNIADIKVVPWANGYAKAQDVPGTVLFSTTYTKQRINMFKWVGPIINAENAVIGLKGNKYQIDTADDLKKYKIGAVRDDVNAQLMEELGVPESNMQLVAKPVLNLRKLMHGNIDLIAYDPSVIKWLAKLNDMDPNELETVYPLDDGELFYAFHKSTSDSLIAEFQAALDELKKEPQGGGDSEYQKIVNKYLK